MPRYKLLQSFHGLSPIEAGVLFAARPPFIYMQSYEAVEVEREDGGDLPNIDGGGKRALIASSLLEPVDA